MATLHAPPPSTIATPTSAPTSVATTMVPSSSSAAPAASAAGGARLTKTRKMVGDRWVVSKRIGQGSFATVWRGVDEKTTPPRDVAIKGISREKINVNKKHQENLDLEIDIMKKLQHPNIIQLYDVHPTRGHIYLILEFAGGGDLSHYIRAHGAMTEHVAKGFMRHLVAGLKFLRDHAIIHRDLKPQNLLLDADRPDAVLKIADFGFARYIHQESLAATLCGSPLYMAPEILRYQKYDGRKADLWSVGAILFEMLTARPPWTGANHVQLLERIERTELKWPERDRVSQPCSDLITKLLKRNPAERLSFEDFLLHPFVAGFDLSASGSVAPAKAAAATAAAAAATATSLTIASSAPATMTAPVAPSSPAPPPPPSSSSFASVPVPSTPPSSRPIVPLVDPSTVTHSSPATTVTPPNATIVNPSSPAAYTPPSYPTGVDNTSGGPLAVHPAASGRTRTASVSSRPMQPVAALATIAAGGGSPSLQPMQHSPLPGSPSLQPVNIGTSASHAQYPQHQQPPPVVLSGQSAEDELDIAILYIFDTKFPATQEWVVSADDARYFVNLLLKTITFTRVVEALDVWPSRLNEWLHKDMHHAIGTRIIERLNQPKAQRLQQQLQLQQQQRNAAGSGARHNSVAQTAGTSSPGGTGGYVVTSNAIGGPRIMVAAPPHVANTGSSGAKKSPSMSPINHAKQYGSGELPMDYVLVDDGDNSPAISKTSRHLGGGGSSENTPSTIASSVSSPSLHGTDTALLYDGSVSGSEQKATTPSTHHQHGSNFAGLRPTDIASSPMATTPPASAAAPTFSSEEEALEAFYAMWKRALMVAKGAEMKEQLASSSASLSHVDFSSSAASAATNSSSAAPSSSTSTTASAAAAAAVAAQYGPLSVSLVLYIKALSMYHFAIASIADYRRAHAVAMMAVAGSSPTASPVAMRIETFLQRCVADFQKLLKRAEGVRERMRDVQSTRAVRLSPWLEAHERTSSSNDGTSGPSSSPSASSTSDDAVAAINTECAEKVMHDWGLALAQEGALCEMGGDSLGAIKKYKRASLLFDQLALENEHRARAMAGLPPSLAPIPPPHTGHTPHHQQQQARDPRLLADAATLRRIRADIEVRVEFIDRQLRVVGV